MSVELKVGQVWKDREGRKVTIARKSNSGFGFQTVSKDGDAHVYEKGTYWNSGKESQYDLIELVQDENGWRPWKATAYSVCPVGGWTLIVYRLSNGVEDSAFAGEKIWSTACGFQIVAYKIVQEAPQAPKPVHAEAHRSPQRTPRRHSHYFKDVSQINEIDVYRVCELFGVDDPSGATQHAVKKLLCAGQRGAKDRAKDYQEAIDTLTRRVEMWVEGQQ